MTPRLRLLFAAVAGAFAALGQAPYDLPVLLFAGMIAAVWLFQGVAQSRQAAWVGWAFGLGYFIHALQWIVSPFLVDVARHGWMAPFALVFLAAGMALFWGVAFWGARKLSTRSFALILCWPAAELVRAYIFTGFPWAMPAQAMVNVAPGQMLAWAGPYVLTLWLVVLAVVSVEMWQGGAGAKRLAGPVFAAAIAVLISMPVSAPDSALTDHTIRLVQPNVAQRDKWDPDQIPIIFRRQLSLTAAPPKAGQADPDLVIWSETAIPWALDLAGSTLNEIAFAGGTAPVTLGVLRRSDAQYFNSMAVLGPDGTPAQVYDKHHLVPFGEYMPLGNLMGRLGIHGLAARDGHGYSRGPGAKLLDFGPLGKALPLICYEAVFAHDVNAAPERPAFLIQITNDAWFGKGAGPKQHLAQARMRAIEQGLPLARAANTGISAMIDPKGRITAALRLNTQGALDAALPAPLPPTLYSRTGDLPFTLLLLVGLGLMTIRRNQT